MNKKRKNQENLLKNIEELRRHLVKLVQEKGVGHIDVVILSQRLDEYLVQFHKNST
ncbi:aspartyl-phosphate phosphatase Spo0E family protein [Brevibacillus sp. SAFN-007a]|uniref:aspartyl-phosphate phosphatase Spo0E family protein n=1 Tax=Brevibacillus sp. SAFN-007a TaxID=3436862 RepID=UPI003F7E1F70